MRITESKFSPFSQNQILTTNTEDRFRGISFDLPMPPKQAIQVLMSDTYNGKLYPAVCL